MTREELVAFIAAVRGAIPSDRPLTMTASITLDGDKERTKILITGTNPFMRVTALRDGKQAVTFYTHPDMHDEP